MQHEIRTLINLLYYMELTPKKEVLFIFVNGQIYSFYNDSNNEKVIRAFARIERTE